MQFVCLSLPTTRGHHAILAPFADNSLVSFTILQNVDRQVSNTGPWNLIGWHANCGFWVGGACWAGRSLPPTVNVDARRWLSVHQFGGYVVTSGGRLIGEGHNMTFQQVHDIFNRVRDYHRQFRDAAAHVQRESGNASVEWIANGIREHEQNWQIALAMDSSNDEVQILETWIQYVPDESLVQELEAIVVTKEMTINDVAELAIRFHSTLLNLYTALSNQVSAPRAQELFTRLAELEKTVVAKQAWAARTI
jgi:hypothetical protein